MKRLSSMLLMVILSALVFTAVSEARFFDSCSGRWTTRDPLEEAGDINLYRGMRNNAVNFIDPMGLDIAVSYYPRAAAGFGHVGFGLSGEKSTYGFYPTGNPLDSPGEIRLDTQKENQSKIIKSTPEQDVCMQECREKWTKAPGQYQLHKRQCTEFVRECMKECSLPFGDYGGPRPYPFFINLPNK